MKIKKITVLSIIALILFSGCSQVVKVQSEPIEIKNQGSRIDNIQLCYDLTLAKCKQEHPFSCVGVEMTAEPICEEDRCLC